MGTPRCLALQPAVPGGAEQALNKDLLNRLKVTFSIGTYIEKATLACEPTKGKRYPMAEVVSDVPEASQERIC